MRQAITALVVAAVATIAMEPAVAGEAVPKLSPALRTSAFIDVPGARRPIGTPAQARLAPTGEKATTEQRELLARFKALGHDDGALRTVIYSPATVGEFFPLFYYIEDESGVPARERELIILRAAWLTQNAFLWARHVPRAAKAGFDAKQIRAIATGARAGGWSDFDRVLISLTDEMFRNSSVSDRTWSELTIRYSVPQAMDAAVTAIHMLESGTLFNTFGIQPDEGSAAARLPTDIAYRVSAPKREAALLAARVGPAEGTGIAVMRTMRRNPQLASKWYANSQNLGNTNATPGDAPPRGQGGAPRGDAGPRGQGAASRGGQGGVPPGDADAVAPHDRELVVLRMGWNCQSDYEWAQHVGSSAVGQGLPGGARNYGIDTLDVARGAIGKSWTEKDRALITAVDELYRDSIISDATWARLQAQFSPTQLASLVSRAARYRRVSTILNTLGVQIEPGEERLPVLKD